ncbi:hypothetical protein BMETH_2471_0 [methanotrophic bacterial endosymbiont of Bathymodiolus sp.]|nr:hypothetical protein BMETH_2471_0 [methanotrophic bacterial endosymbiont of Bathymodiolus sp.]
MDYITSLSLIQPIFFEIAIRNAIPDITDVTHAITFILKC